MTNSKKIISIFMIVLISSIMMSISILINNLTSMTIDKKNIARAEILRDKMLNNAVQVRKINSEDPSVISLIGISKNDLTSGYMFETTAGLCCNNVRIIVGVAPNGRITNIELIDSDETSAVRNKLLGKDFLNKFNYNIRRNYIPDVNNIIPVSKSITEAIRKIAYEFDIIRDKNYRG